jgi:hypothetical protein
MRSSRSVLVVILFTLGALLTLGPPAAAAPAPWVQVSPATGLKGGDVVRLSAGGFTPGQSLQVIQCDELPASPAEGCPVAKDVTADSHGRVHTRVTLTDPLIHAQEVGRGYPVYCRGDGCHLFVSFVDDNGERQGAGSKALKFKGSPATITVTPSTNLGEKQWVTVKGTAFGAEGHRVGIREHVCFNIVQDVGCYGSLKYKWTHVSSNGTYKVSYLARRHVPNDPEPPVDCAGDPNERLGDCMMTAVILDRQGNPDDSFGFAETFGDPSGALSFAGGGA